MKILALEFSTEYRSVAVFSDNGIGDAKPAIARAESNDRAVGPLTCVEEALRTAGIAREAVECIAIGLGPGSYTGIRSAIAIAQGWQLARGIHLLGVNTVECLAEQARISGIHGRVNFVIDAQRNEFYQALYDIDARAAVQIEPLRIVPFAEVESRTGAGERIAGPEVTRWFAGGLTLLPDAGVLAALAASREDFAQGESLHPIYLREAKFLKAPPPRVIP